MWTPPIPNNKAAWNSEWLQAPPVFSCARGPGTLCLRRCVDTSSSKNAMGQEHSFPYWQLNAMHFCWKGIRESSVGKWIGFELVGEVPVQFLGGADFFLFTKLCLCVRDSGKSAGESSACSAEARINGNIPPRHIHLHWVHSNYLNFTLTPNRKSCKCKQTFTFRLEFLYRNVRCHLCHLLHCCTDRPCYTSAR